MIKFVQYQDCKSPHQLPLACELLRRLGVDSFRFVYRDADQADRAAMGWKMAGTDESWQLHIGSHPEEARELIENAEVLFTGMREIDLFERRAAKGLKTFYQTERWFKPIDLAGCLIPGWVRLLHPRYLSMALRFRRLARRSPMFHVLPIGVHARRDMRLIGVPERRMTTWGYFVAPSEQPVREHDGANRPVRILWVGRMLKLKHVDTIVAAVRKVVHDGNQGNAVQLLLVGDGPERPRLERLASGLPVSFTDSVPIPKVRELMRQNDVYVFASNGHDGWGAVVSEALEEGMIVFGTQETGAGSTILPPERQFSACDVIGLARLLRKAAIGDFEPTGIGEWSAEKGAERLMGLLH